MYVRWCFRGPVKTSCGITRQRQIASGDARVCSVRNETGKAALAGVLCNPSAILRAVDVVQYAQASTCFMRHGTGEIECCRCCAKGGLRLRVEHGGHHRFVLKDEPVTGVGRKQLVLFSRKLNCAAVNRLRPKQYLCGGFADAKRSAEHPKDALAVGQHFPG